ncbi:prion-like-(Q/N-rich) domain-bearing protein 25 isoform X2 [Ostrea edulis]|uniref:prion-like-(Q/N-rich) domain-bearing protein 25 isoform X2 n=1 Tax=Ostrea edulis TaxID=37623 RepID=UPI0024AEF5EF|nr:prion-like-(Q/N-rich) domain-bearing protein 25 isoform X2 [Ostrea edulis]
MRGRELVDIFLFVIGMDGMLLPSSSKHFPYFQEEFRFKDIIRFVHSNQSCDFFLQEIPSLIRQDKSAYHQNEETCILLTSFDHLSSNESLRLSGVVVRLYANVKKYEFSVMSNQCKGNSSFNGIQIHASCQLTKAHSGNICEDGIGCNTEKEFCRKLFQDESEKGLCIVGMSLNESCSHDRQCTGTANAGRCQQKKHIPDRSVCSCNPGFFQNGSNCLQGKRRLFQTCESHKQCTGSYGARECKVIAGIQMCHCPDNHTVFRDVCIKVGSVIGESCTVHEECTGTKNGGRCVYSEGNGTKSQTCACNEGFLKNASFCLPVNKKLFETCEVNDQCNGTLGLGICRTVGDRKVCVCGSQYIENMASLTCHKVGKDIFETCTLNAQCTRTKNADVCKYKTETQANSCACRDGFEWVNASCVPIGRQLLETCEYDLQCNGTANATVCGLFGNRSLCFCDKGMLDFNGACIEAGKYLGESCEIDRQCTETLYAGVCGENSSCSCDNGFIREDKDCIRVGRQLLESCEYDLQCSGTTNATVCGLFGNRSLCFCNEGMLEFNGTCIAAGKGLGEPCEIDRQCTETLHAGVCGENSSCSCDSGFITEDKGCIRGGWNQDMIYQFMLVGAGGLLFGIFCLIGITICKYRRNLLSKSGRFVVQTDQEPCNCQSILYAVPSDIGNHVGPSSLVHKDAQIVANYSYNHLHEPVEQKKDNAYSELDSCDDVYNHLHEKDAPLCEGVYGVTENVFNDMKHSSDDNSESVGLYDFAEIINANMC